MPVTASVILGLLVVLKELGALYAPLLPVMLDCVFHLLLLVLEEGAASGASFLAVMPDHMLCRLRLVREQRPATACRRLFFHAFFGAGRSRGKDDSQRGDGNKSSKPLHFLIPYFVLTSSDRPHGGPLAFNSFGEGGWLHLSLPFFLIGAVTIGAGETNNG
jgi:hypothetical protein